MKCSILIVHYNTPGLLRQTLKGIFGASISVPFEVIVVDNNPDERVGAQVTNEFPEVQVLTPETNIGFGRGMNWAMEKAKGEYVLVFNPDIAVFKGELEKLIAYLDAHKDVGIVAPRLNNPDGTIQYSCFRFMEPKTIAYRRIPLLGKLSFAKNHVDTYLMKEWDHAKAREVDYVLGAAMLVRVSAMNEVGGFDPNYFMYFEDQDWCRRFWEKGWKVVYEPAASLVHYHRRETAQGGFLSQIFNPLTRIQLQSALYYYKKYRDKPLPHVT